jgi:hypothetical protein
MNKPDLTPSMQELIAQMAALRAEFNALQQRANSLPQPVQPAQTVVSTNRRSVLRKLAGGLLAGLAVGGVAVVIPQPVEAKFVGASNAGAVIIPHGSTATGSMGANRKYGLVANSDDSTDLSNEFYFANGDRIGVYGIATNATDDPPGAFAGIGVYGIGTQGIFGYSPGFTGVNGFGDTGVGASGNTTGILGIGGKFGGLMELSANSSTPTFSQTNTGIGLAVNAGSSASFSNVQNNQNLGLYVEAGTAPGSAARTAKAAIFKGDVQIVGTISKSSGTFMIDHPLDPTNKFLYHSFVESPDMKNVYDGVVTLDDRGEASVEMPSYFEALNSDYRYQLTPLGRAAPNLHILEEMKQRQFKIAGGLAGQKVSWQVTGIRQDAYAKANPIKVEEDKTGEQKGTYLHPEAFGQPQKQQVQHGPLVGADLQDLINRKFGRK